MSNKIISSIIIALLISPMVNAESLRERDLEDIREIENNNPTTIAYFQRMFERLDIGMRDKKEKELIRINEISFLAHDYLAYHNDLDGFNTEYFVNHSLSKTSENR